MSEEKKLDVKALAAGELTDEDLKAVVGGVTALNDEQSTFVCDFLMTNCINCAKSTNNCALMNNVISLYDELNGDGKARCPSFTSKNHIH